MLYQMKYGHCLRFICLAVDAHGVPVSVFITQGTTADYPRANRLIEGPDVDYLLAIAVMLVMQLLNRQEGRVWKS
ncbi:hypothetical protein SAMN05216419_10569 [Nitrosomonas cryotolerans]|nr:hypothetical protein SAMN05216419_10569 [Nitrosomonas cryotolerans]